MPNCLPCTSRAVFRTPSPADAALDEPTIHIWSVGLDASPQLLRELDEVLGADERARARRFRFDHLTRAYTAGRGLMRLALAAYLDEPPERLVLLRTATGKPYLRDTPLRFNISHSGDKVMFAFAHHVDVGVDIERIRPLPDFMTVASRYFCLTEYRELLAMPEESRMRAFYSLWTTKEACLKSTSEGLSVPLDTVEVVNDREARRTTPAAGHAGTGSSWSTYDVSPSQEYAACLAVSPGIRGVDCWRFEDTTEAANFCRAMRRRSWHLGGVNS